MLLSSVHANSDLPKPKCNHYPGLCHYVDAGSGEELVGYHSDSAHKFSEGLAGVRIGDHYGFIDLEGEIVIKPRFDFVGSFYQGLAEVMVDGRAGVINRFGETMVELKFRRAIPFTKDVILYSQDERHRPPYNIDLSLSDFEGRSLSERVFGLYHLRKGRLTDPTFFFRRLGHGGTNLVWATWAGKHDLF
jgi:hypothetical protein